MCCCVLPCTAVGFACVTLRRIIGLSEREEVGEV